MFHAACVCRKTQVSVILKRFFCAKDLPAICQTKLRLGRLLHQKSQSYLAKKAPRVHISRKPCRRSFAKEALQDDRFTSCRNPTNCITRQTRRKFVIDPPEAAVGQDGDYISLA